MPNTEKMYEDAKPSFGPIKKYRNALATWPAASAIYDIIVFLIREPLTNFIWNIIR